MKILKAQRLMVMVLKPQAEELTGMKILKARRLMVMAL